MLEKVSLTNENYVTSAPSLAELRSRTPTSDTGSNHPRVLTRRRPLFFFNLEQGRHLVAAQRRGQTPNT